jgi:hypothetical protein
MQGRYPAASAAAGVAKKETLRGWARRAAQDGRQ